VQHSSSYLGSKNHIIAEEIDSEEEDDSDDFFEKSKEHQDKIMRLQSIYFEKAIAFTAPRPSDIPSVK
jgi:hypothetical protein